ncbi:hypothetical protein BcepSauron_027 [Burkholderia phage BcepSauron]|uniref:Uncharacterized protein n=2 Tax=Sarumanvirus TaxID=2843450 RepID=A0A482MK53_9CAUD|nr:hypothetical protein H1O16_gp026 [Burkholderia phage BcepSaruman]YP_009904405.1 hypothetical protein H1O17_gp027 [Burkholderia phage BcepSauron]QBQ74407.1 hypothetical protein BcepSauron_027 [Burkholderia phage BcepSauron]QBX06439.1 hypothetical protein BcepSaruman_026 [Burkholderia phage BcepSaruman]
MSLIRARKNMHGNWIVYIGRTAHPQGDSEMAVCCYMAELIEQGHVVSAASEIDAAQVAEAVSRYHQPRVDAEPVAKTEDAAAPAPTAWAAVKRASAKARELDEARTGYTADGNCLVIDGTADDGTLQGDGRDAPFYVFDVTAQRNIAGPFQTMDSARTGLVRELMRAHFDVQRKRDAEQHTQSLITQCSELGFAIQPIGDNYRYSARFWVEDSGLFDTVDEAAQACIDRHPTK